MQKDDKEKGQGSRSINAGRDIIDNQIFQGDINASTLKVSKDSSNRTISTVSISNETLEKMSKEYAQSLQSIKSLKRK